MGLKKMVYQHIDWRTAEMPIGMQKKMAELGVKMESFAKQTGISADNFIMSSDQGMFPNLRAVRGYACNVQEHLNGGVAKADLKVML